MTEFSISRTTTEGFESIYVQTGLLELTLIPELGGKVSSLRDTRTGREWLWRHPRFAYKRVPHGSSYINHADTGGWDECFPSVAECKYPSLPYQDAAIQDHGELWSQAPEFEMEGHETSATLRTRWHGVALPYTFTRAILLNENSSRIRVDYGVMNVSDQPLNFVWCIHPLLAIEPGMELRLPPTAQFNVGGAIPFDLVSTEKKLRYPFSADGLDFPRVPETSTGKAIKIWSDPLTGREGQAAVCAKDGELRMRWDATLLPQVAVWMNFGAWSADGGSPYFNLGLEPCIGGQDSLADAVTKYNLFASLPPHGRRMWWLEIELTA